MELKDFQQSVLDRLDLYLDELVTEKEAADEVSALLREHPTIKLKVPD